MPRVKRGVTARASHKRVLDAAKGYRGRRKNVFRVANEAVMKAGQYAYRDRRQRMDPGVVLRANQHADAPEGIPETANPLAEVEWLHGMRCLHYQHRRVFRGDVQELSRRGVRGSPSRLPALGGLDRDADQLG